MAAEPILFQPSMEQAPPDEAETIQALTDAMRSITETTFKDSGHAVRSVHAKAHGLLRGELHVRSDLPPALAQGAFAKAGTYPVIMRFSTNPGDILDDSVSTPRGLAIKIVGVDGERLPGTENETTQDFVMQNAPAFSAPDPKAFLGTLKTLAKTTDTPQILKKTLSAVLRGAEKTVEAFGGESATLKSLGGHPATHILGETFYTMVPFLYGPHVAKLSVAPVSAGLVTLADKPVHVAGRPDALREEVTEFFERQGGEWEIRIQLNNDLERMPIEDASVPWPEDESPYVTVARITVPAQGAWSEQHRADIDEGMAFTPWHGLAAHRPLGGIMRSRKPAYEASAEFRATRNGCPIHEPRAHGAQA